MTTEDPLLSQFQQALDKIQNAYDAFEEHFLWLEDAVSNAKQTFAHCDTALLPKTPAAKKRCRQKKTDSAISLDDGESLSKRSSIESTLSQTEEPSLECPPVRKGRAAARIAQERVALSLKESSVRKLRRPSTPVDTSRTTTKIKTSKRMETTRDSVEIVKHCQEKSSVAAEPKTRFVEVEDCKSVKSPSSSKQSSQRSTWQASPEKIVSPVSVSQGPRSSQCPEVDTNVIDTEEESQSTTDISEKIPLRECSKISLAKDEDSEGHNTEIAEDEEENLKIQTSVVVDKEPECSESEGSSKITEIAEPVTNDLSKETAVAEKILKVTHSDPETVKEAPVPRIRSTRTKQREVLTSSSAEESESSDCKFELFITETQPVPKPRTTRTKEKPESQIGNSIEVVETQMLPPADIPKVIMKTKVKDTESMEVKVKENEECNLQNTVESVPSPEEVKSRSTRTKKKHVEELSEDVPKPRSTRTKKRGEEVILEKEDGLKDIISESEDTSSTSHSRSTRTKKRQVEEQITQPSRSTRTKKRKMEEEADGEANKENVSSFSITGDELKASESPVMKASVLKNIQSSTEIPSVENATVIAVGENKAAPKSTANSRVTRSKVRPPPVTKSPKVASPYDKKPFRSPSKYPNSPRTPNRDPFKRDCCTPKSSEKGTLKSNPQASSRVASPLRNSPRFCLSDKIGRNTFKTCDILTEVEEIALEDIEVGNSPMRITRHSHGKSVRSPDARFARINPPPKTPSPQCPTDKIVRPKFGHLVNSNSSFGSSGRITPKTYSRIKPSFVNSFSSSEYSKTQKKTVTPELKRTNGIVTGITSFIKIHPAKPTRQDLVEKKQLDLQKKREREEETRKKQEELLKSKAEEQKRRNEERMRRAKEAREQRERKLVEAKEQQERDKKMREERLKEEQNRKKLQMLAKKQAEEEAKARKIKQMEEERRLEEIRLEEIRRAEDARKAEEERKEEEKRKKRVAEVERIARERKEMEHLRLREEERLKAAQQAQTNAALNSTYTKDTVENKENCTLNATFTKNVSSTGSQERSDSYEMTPDRKKKTKNLKMKNGNDYNIHDLKSDDSTDDDQAPKKTIPGWAYGNHLKASLINQEYYPPDVDAIFPPLELLLMPDLSTIFPIIRTRFLKRTSSAIWSSPPGKLI